MKLTIDGGLLMDLLKAAESAIEGDNKECLMELHDDRWVMRVRDQSDVLMFACRVEREVMEHYDKGTEDVLGIKIEKLQDAIVDTSSNVTLETRTETGATVLSVKQGGFDARVALVNPDYVDVQAKKVPQIDYAVSVTGDLSWLFDFVKRADKLVAGEAYLISPRQGAVYLYAYHDHDSAIQKVYWEDFDSYSIDWSKGFSHDGYGVDPEEEQGTDVLLSLSWTKGIELISDTGTIFLDNHAPMKILFDMPDGVDASYFISPRIPTGQDTIEKLPDDVIEERGLETSA